MTQTAKFLIPLTIYTFLASLVTFKDASRTRLNIGGGMPHYHPAIALRSRK